MIHCCAPSLGQNVYILVHPIATQIRMMFLKEASLFDPSRFVPWISSRKARSGSFVLKETSKRCCTQSLAVIKCRVCAGSTGDREPAVLVGADREGMS